ncbi:increased DNA methylation 1-like [Triticum dicoccoides]|uniref:increased DNA methylation 1-like n=1 Tax=Triticum dicoccoides TaxID=85692 RepID=UPI00188E5CB8|nr:increased DNA methylation 1-like [Triticum dicoccoides]
MQSNGRTPPLFSPESGRGMPPPVVYSRKQGASADGGPSAILRDGGGNHHPSSTDGGHGQPVSERLLQIVPANTRAGKGKNVPPAGGTAVPANGRVRKTRAPKGSSTLAESRKVPGKKSDAGEPAGMHHGTQDNDQLKTVSAPSNSRNRKSTASASAVSSSRRPRRNNSSTSGTAAAGAKKHTILTWLIDCGVLKENEKVSYADSTSFATKASGAVTRAGIQCTCCDAAMAPPAFSSHAGSEDSAPWERLLLKSGKSLLECVREAWEGEHLRILHAKQKAQAAVEKERERSTQEKKRALLLAKQSRKEPALALDLDGTNYGGDDDRSDDACGVCADGGQLLCCDNCPSTFHPECLAVEVPEDSWVCHYCRCFLCSADDDGHGGLSICHQCTRKYHHHCRAPLLAGHEIGPYCSKACNKIAVNLSNMVGAMVSIGEEGHSWSLLKFQEGSVTSDPAALLECNAKLAVALGVLNECFNPVKDRLTGIDMLHQAVYSVESDFKRLSYQRFYTIVLEKDTEIISVALLRFHGAKLAEMPFACTLLQYHRQGMMRLLVNAIDKVLQSVQVENLVISAVDEVVDTWKKLGFEDVEPQLRDEAKRLSMVAIAGTILLQKPTAKQDMLLITENERAFLEMSWPRCSFVDLLTGTAFPWSPYADPVAVAVRGAGGGGGEA